MVVTKKGSYNIALPEPAGKLTTAAVRKGRGLPLASLWYVWDRQGQRNSPPSGCVLEPHPAFQALPVGAGRIPPGWEYAERERREWIVVHPRNNCVDIRGQQNPKGTIQIEKRECLEFMCLLFSFIGRF